jgi:hypothetical protein
MLQSPPSRYKIIERGRRLVTIDTLTGQEVGLGNTLVSPDAPVDLPIQSAHVATPMESSSPVSSPVPPTPGVRRAPLRANEQNDSGRAMRTVHVVIAAIALIAFLIFTGLWMIAAVALFIVPVRQWLLSALKRAATRYIDQAAKG